MSDIFTEIEKQIQARAGHYAEMLNFYSGLQWPLPCPRGGRQLVVNYAQVNIEKTTSYLMADMAVAIDPQDKTNAAKAAEAEALLNQVEADNDCEDLDYTTERDAALLGDGCYKVTWDIDAKRIRITALPAEGLAVWYWPHDPSRVYQIASQYKLPTGETATEVWTDKRFDYYVAQRLNLSMLNPYSFIPIIHFPNLRKPREFWGKSDIEPIIEIQKELNRAISQISLVLELSGNPITVIEGAEDAEDIAVKPGAVWTLPEKAKAYLLDLLEKGGLNLHMDYIETLYRAMHDTNETPKSAFGQTERDLSGTALEIEMQPLVQKIRRKRRIRTAVYRRRAEMILALAKQFMQKDFGAVTPRIIWGDLLPDDFHALAETETQLVGKLIHTRKRAAEMLGVEDTEQELTDALKEREQILSQSKKFGSKQKGENDSVSVAE